MAEDPRIALLRRCCVLIPGRGTGFFVGPQTVLTCAHVLSGIEAGARLTLVTHNGSSPEATVIDITSADWPDLALLDIPGHVSEFVVRLGGAIVLGDALFAAGYPQYGAQQRADGIEGKWESDSWQYAAGDDPQKSLPNLPRIKFKDSLVVGGFSGSPLLNLRTGEVVGIVSESRGLNAPVGGWAIPALSASETFPELDAVQEKVRREDDIWQDAIKQAAVEAVPPPWLAFRPTFERLDGAQRAEQATRESGRFLYTSRRTDFYGRSDELAELKTFIESPAPFCWQGLFGPGGAGKSRTALQLLESLGRRWDGGFLERAELNDLRWNEWRPLLPTLIIIDDADIDQSDAVRARVALLANRAAATPGGLGWPVRLLLIGRNLAFMQAALSDLERARVDASRHSGDIKLGEMQSEDLASLVGELCPGREEMAIGEILREIARIDPENRPLFAQFVAEAVQEGGIPSEWDRVDLLRDVLKRERDSRWHPAGVTDEDRRIVMFGTLCAPLPTAQLTAQAKHHPEIEARLSSDRKRRIETMLGSAFAPKQVPALQPDILGTIFALEELRSLDDDDPELRAECLALAWRLNPAAAGVATTRAIEEFPRHPQAAALLEVEPEAAFRLEWVEAASFAVHRRHAGWWTLTHRLGEHRDFLLDHIGSLIEDYEKSRSADALDDLWAMILILFRIDMDRHRLEYHALWCRVMDLPLPRHSLSPEQTFEDVKSDHELLADLSAVFAIWGVKAANGARTLHFAHRKAKDRASARSVRTQLAERAATLSPSNANNFDVDWAAMIKLRRDLVRDRQFSVNYRPSQGGIPLPELMKELVELALSRNLFGRTIDYRVDPADEDLSVLSRSFSADIERGYMLVENGIHNWSEPLARDIIAAIHRDLAAEEFELIREEFLATANELLSAAAASRNAANG